MSDVSQILSRIDSGDPEAAAQLLPLVYDELRKLAAVRLNHESAGQTLQATALVHEAYMRLVQGDQANSHWDNRAHFFAAAAEAMRRILVDAARRKRNIKHGGGLVREDHEPDQLPAPEPREDLVALDAALEKTGHRRFTGRGAGEATIFCWLHTPRSRKMAADSQSQRRSPLAYARAWLHQEISASQEI